MTFLASQCDILPIFSKMSTNDESDYGSAPRKRGAQGDRRPYPTTNVPSQDGSDGPQKDSTDSRIAWWFGKRIYLGNNTQIGNLFWLLAKTPGSAHLRDELQTVIDGFTSDPNMVSAAEVRKSEQRIRQVVSRLRAALRESGLNDHVAIHSERTDQGPAITLAYRFARPRASEAA